MSNKHSEPIDARQAQEKAIKAQPMASVYELINARSDAGFFDAWWPVLPNLPPENIEAIVQTLKSPRGYKVSISVPPNENQIYLYIRWGFMQ